MQAPLDELTEPQRRAVVRAGGPLLVTGVAGSGKTTVLAHRFAHLAAQEDADGHVLALARDAAARAAFCARLEALVPPPHGELHVHTLRELCASLLADEALEAGLDPLFVTVSRADRVALLLDNLDRLSLRRHEIRGNPAPLLASFVERIDALKREMTSPEAFAERARLALEAAEEAGDAERARAKRDVELADLYAAHDRLLADRGALDEGDLVLTAFRLLHERPHVRERVARRFAHVLVDDYQELTFAEGTLVRLLSEERGSLTAAGDDAQALHPPRADAATNVGEFAREFPGAETIDLGPSQRRPAPARFWRCASERAQAQAVAAEAERLIADGARPDEIAVLVPSLGEEAATIGAALEERAVPFRVHGSAAFFQRAEVRDVLAWLRVLADPADSGAAVRALTRAPIELHSVDVARLTQLARRRKLDMPAAVAAALEGPQLSPEGRDRAQAFLTLYRAASEAFESRRPDAFVLRLVENIGLRRQQVFATQADTVERLRNIARLPEIATAYMRREPHASPRDFARYLQAVADSGLPAPEAGGGEGEAAVRVMAMGDAAGGEHGHVFVVGLSAGRMPAERERLFHVSSTRAREGLVLAWAESGNGTPSRPSPLYERLRTEADTEEERFEEELLGPAEGLHSTFRIMRDELLDTVARVGGRLGEMRLDAGLDVSQAVAHYLELVKVAALIERRKAGQPLDEALSEVNQLLAQGASAEQRELLEASALDDWLRDAGRDPERRPAAGADGAGPSLDPFIPRRRGDGAPEAGLMLSASDIETYRLCPLKYKFARVFRIPQEPTIHQRFGIALHTVLDRFHRTPGGDRETLLELFEAAWRRGGFGDSDDELQFRERGVEALERYWENTRDEEGEPVWFERSFAFTLGPHMVRGRVDRVDRRPDGSYEVIDYKTGRAKTADELRRDVQLSLYQMGARAAWGVETSAHSYYYVMTAEKVPVAHSEEELDRVRDTVEQIGSGIARQEFQPTPSAEICSFCDYRIICPAAER
jgi:DNA helicase-2/ATP-dependent DNA helicase PcrA